MVTSHNEALRQGFVWEYDQYFVTGMIYRDKCMNFIEVLEVHTSIYIFEDGANVIRFCELHTLHSL